MAVDILNQLYSRVDPLRLADRTLEFVEIASPTGNEKEFSRHYAEVLKSIGMAVEMTDEYHDSPNVIGTYAFTTGRTLQFDGHSDTIDKPHEKPCVKDGRVYGRGACDMKGSLAAMTEAARILIES
ncbi:MAG: M20/M25/M40 family metallo-hydrolase, partial [Armatimonadota bacterium]